MSVTKYLLASCLVAAIAALCVYGQSSPETYNKGGGGWYGGSWNSGSKRGSLRIIANAISKTPATEPQPIGTTAVVIYSLACESDPDRAIVGQMAGTAIYFDNTGENLLNFQLTLELVKSCGRYPPGKIFLVGDGSGLYASSSYPKAIVGGTGPYVGRLGSMVSGPNKLRILTFTN
eukprot:gene8040-8235_t